MEALAAASDDALIREAVHLNAFEERRHKDVLGHMIRFYGIELEPEEPYVAPDRVRSGVSCALAMANASIPSSPSACSRWPRSRVSFRPNWWRCSSR